MENSQNYSFVYLLKVEIAILVNITSPLISGRAKFAPKKCKRNYFAQQALKFGLFITVKLLVVNILKSKGTRCAPSMPNGLRLRLKWKIEWKIASTHL